MTEPGGGGDRLEVSVVADATGFAKDAQAKIDAAVASVRAKIKVDVDLRRLQAQTEAAAKRVQQTAKIQLQVGVDRKYLQESIRAAMAGIGGDRTIKVGVDVDRSALDGALAGGTGGSVDVDVDADTSGASARVAEFRENAEREPIDVPVQIDPKSTKSLSQGGRGIRMITGAMSGLQKVGFYAGLVQSLASAATAAGGGLIAMAGSASQAMGVLGALPSLIGVAVQGLGALFAGFSGIGDAVGALGKAQSGAAKSGASAAKAQENAAKRIADAQKSLRRAIVDQQRTARDGDRAVIDARRKVSETYATASGRIQAAEKKVADAQAGTLRAQQALNKARVEATEQLQDYQLQLAGAALDEEGATLAVARSREAWNKAMRNPVSTDLDRKEADLALRQAEQSLKEIQERNQDLREEAAAATTAGVEGSAAVVAAKDNVQEATEKEQDATADLRDARVEAADDIAEAEQDLADKIVDTSESNSDAAERVADAQENLAEAFADMRDAAASGAAGIDLAQQAMDKLSPAGQKFARFLNDVMKPRMMEFRNAIQQELLPGVQSMLESLNKDPGDALGSYFDVLQTGMTKSARIMGDTAKAAGEMMATPGFRADTAMIMEDNNKALSAFSGAGLNLLPIFRDLAVEAGPLLIRFAEWTRTLTEGWAASVGAARETGALGEFFEKAGDKAAQLAHIGGNLVGIIKNVFGAGAESGDDLLAKFDQWTQKWETWTGTTQGQERLGKFFERMQPLFESLAKLGGKVAELFVKMGEDGGTAVDGFVRALIWVVDLLTWLFDSPLGPFISSLMQFAGIAAVISLVGGSIMGLVSSIGILLRFGGLIITVVKQISFVMRILSMTNPLGLIITAIALLVAGLIWAYNNVDWFREFVDKAFGLITTAISAAFNWVKDNWPLLLAILTGPIGLAVLMIVKHWDDIVAGARVVRDAIVAAFVWVRDRVVAAISALRDGTVAAFTWTRDRIVDAATWVRDTVVGAFEWTRDRVVGAVNYLRDRAVAAFEYARDRIVGAATWVRDTAVGAFDWMRDRVTGALQGIGDFAGSIWDGLGNGLRAALNAIIRTFNTGISGVNQIIGGVNNLPGISIGKIPSIPYLAEGAVIRRPTLAVVGEDGPEVVLPLSQKRAARRAQLMEQAGLSSSSRMQTPASRSALGGWAALDQGAGSMSTAELVATSGGAVDRAAPGDTVGTIIQEGAVQISVSNPAPEPVSGTLNSTLRRVADLGIFDSKPAAG